jgi:deoxyribose-phosphate aldolase
MSPKISEIISLARDYENQLPDLRLPADHPGQRSLASWVDHTLLKPDATPEQVEKLCTEAREHHFASVCVNPAYVALVHRLLAGSPVLTCSVIGFPLGMTPTEVKVEETRTAITSGAQEVDMVIPVGLLKAEEYEIVFNDIQQVVVIAHSLNAEVKVIIETCLLTRFEKIAACLLAKQARAEFVKTSTGFSTGGATLEDIDLMRRVVGPEMGVKASGGIRSLEDARAMLNAGATRLGTSAGVKIVEQAALENKAAS